MTENEQRANEIATSIMHEGHIDKNGIVKLDKFKIK